jgi:four helix bundle protein
MSTKTSKKYDLEDRTYSFAQKVIRYVDQLPKRTSNFEIGKQLVRSACSVGANYIEANESLSKKDFIMRVKISKKEAKESRYWLNLSNPNKTYERNKIELMCESEELMKIFATIIRNSSV